jgi:hypothetical protein
VIFAAAAWASPTEAIAAGEAAIVSPRPPPPETGLRLVGTFGTRLAATDVGTTSPYVNGQIVGELGGTNTTTVTDETGIATEERAVALLSYAPDALDGKAALEAGFEVDFAWGDSSYATGGNTGGGIGGDQVNLQTRRLAGRFALGPRVATVVGLQFVADGAADPAKATLDGLVRDGGRLLFFGTEMAGISVYGRDERLRWRGGAYTPWELGLSSADDVTLWMADASWSPGYGGRLGGHAWYLRDRAEGSGGLLGTGPTSALSEMQGGPRLDAAPGATDLLWLVGDASFNAALDRGPAGVGGMLALNTGRVGEVDVRGLAGVLEARWRWAPGHGSVIQGGPRFSTGDGAGPGAYTGVVTGNSYGVAATVDGTAGCLLLFSDPSAINRQSAVVYDLSGGGRGLLGATAQVGWDALPNKLTVATGGGWAADAAAETVGAEVNGRVVWRPFVLATLGLYGGALVASEFDRTPWLVHASFDWVIFS